MSKSPGLFIDIGKKARDLLYQDYAQQLPSHFRFENFDSNFAFACQIEEILPGLHTALRVVLPDSGKVELRYLHDYVGIASGVRLKATRSGSIGLDPKLRANPSDSSIDPTLNVSGVIGSNVFSLGGEVAFDVSEGAFTYNAGLSINSALLTSSLTLNDLSTLKGSYHLVVNPLTRTAIAAELKHHFINNGNTTFTVGGQHSLFSSTLVKARMDSDGKVGALIQQDILKKLYLTIAGEADFRDLNKFPKIGCSMAIRP